MKTVVLCPGPSLVNYAPSTGEFRVGVNRAVVRIECDIWVSSEINIIKSTKPIGHPVIFTSRKIQGLLKGVLPFEGCVEDLFAEFPANLSYSLYSATTAAVFAATTGAGIIDVYGCDLSGDADWDGVRADGRTASRWKCEHGIWLNLKGNFARRGIELNFKDQSWAKSLKT